MKNAMTRAGWLAGTGSMFAVTACSTGSIGSGTGAAGVAGTANAQSSTSQYFNVVRGQTAPLSSQKVSQAQITAALSASSSMFADSSTAMTTVNQGNGTSITYLADGSVFANWATSLNGDGSISTGVTMYDGSQYSTIVPPASAFAASGTSTVGNVTLNANPSTGLYAATVLTPNGPMSVTIGQNADGSYYQSTAQYGTYTIPAAAMAWMQPAQQPTAQSIQGRKAEYWGDADCVAAIALLLAIVTAICVAFWYMFTIIAQFALAIQKAIQAAEVAGSLAAGTITGPTTVPAGAVFAAMIAAFLAAFTAAALWISNACATRPVPPPPPPPPPLGGNNPQPALQPANAAAQ